jgi:hypothetical protein
MAKWTAFPYDDTNYAMTPPLKKHWARLHIGDAEPCPRTPPCSPPGPVPRR